MSNEGEQHQHSGGATGSAPAEVTPAPKEPSGSSFSGLPGTYWAAVASAGLLVIGGFGPWATFGPFSVAGTDGDGWFLVIGGAVAGILLARLGSRRLDTRRIDTLIPIAAAAATIVVLIDLVDLLQTELISVGWGAWIGAIAGVALVGLSVALLRPSAGRPTLATVSAVTAAAIGIGVGLATADTSDGGLGNDSAETESLFGDEEEDPADPATPPPTIEVAEQGFSESDGTVSYGAILRNSSTAVGAIGVEVTINFLDDTGTVIATETNSVAAIPPGEEFGVGSSASVEGEQVADLDITVQPAEGADGQVAVPESREARIIETEFGRAARVEVRNSLSEPLSTIADVFFVFRDRSGAIVGGSLTFPDGDIPPGGRSAVEVSDIPDGAADVEVYADAETG